jgi:translocation and assembly module TamB
VEIGANPAGDTGDLTVKVGKYLTEGTYLSISRNISRGKDSDKNSSCFGIETKLGRHFRFRAEGDTETNGRLNLLWKNDY